MEPLPNRYRSEGGREAMGERKNGFLNLYNCDFREVLDKLPDNTIVVTDPPYNIGYKYKGYCDRMPEMEYLQMIDMLVKRFPSVLLAYPEILYKVAVYSQTAPNRVVSWVYNSNTRRQHRDIAFFGGVDPNFRNVLQPYKNKTDKRVKALMDNGNKGTACYDWWEVQQVKNVSAEKVDFPCQIPLQVMKNVVGILPKDRVIFDPFLGSGTTAIACIELNRPFIGAEISKSAYDVATQRIATHRSHTSKEKYFYDRAIG